MFHRRIRCSLQYARSEAIEQESDRHNASLPNHRHRRSGPRMEELRQVHAERSSTNRVSRHVLRRERSEEHTAELQLQSNLVCRLLLETNNNHRLSQLPIGTIQTTIISFDERMRGWLPVIARARNELKDVAASLQPVTLLRSYNASPAP